MTAISTKSRRMSVSFRISDEDRDLITRIAVRAVRAGIAVSMQDAEMDITATHTNGCRLRLLDLLGADDFNFQHDVLGINLHLDRYNGRLTNHFLPRFAENQR